jgi:hypothetical protein
MKLALMLLSLAVGCVAAIRTVEMMNRAANVVAQTQPIS